MTESTQRSQGGVHPALAEEGRAAALREVRVAGEDEVHAGLGQERVEQGRVVALEGHVGGDAAVRVDIGGAVARDDEPRVLAAVGGAG